MSLKNMSLLTGGTVSTSGGSALVFADDGITVQNGVHLVVPATADYNVREQCTAKYRPPALDLDGLYGKDKKSITYTIPFVTASGKTVYNLIRLEREIHPETSEAVTDDFNVIGAQLLSDSDTDGFWATGSTS